eukprot:607014-Pyramimonas_sp.AAC.1
MVQDSPHEAQETKNIQKRVVPQRCSSYGLLKNPHGSQTAQGGLKRGLGRPPRALQERPKAAPKRAPRGRRSSPRAGMWVAGRHQDSTETAPR